MINKPLEAARDLRPSKIPKKKVDLYKQKKRQCKYRDHIVTFEQIIFKQKIENTWYYTKSTEIAEYFLLNLVKLVEGDVSKEEQIVVEKW